MSLEFVLVWLVVGLIAGWLASALVGGGRSLDDSPPPLLDEEDEDAPETSTPQEESQT
jgi:hypothetical protein